MSTGYEQRLETGFQMANLNLDAHNPSHVAGHSVVRANLGGGRELVVISGVAIPEFRIDDDHTHHETCRVHLREPAGSIAQSAAHVGPASIGNDDTEYVLATNEASVAVDDAGELMLVAALAVKGEWSNLGRFGYQVVVESLHLTGDVNGSLTWRAAYFTPPSLDPAAVAGAVTVAAHEFVPPPTGPTGAQLAEGVIVGVTDSFVGTVRLIHARYQITGVPRDRTVNIAATCPGLHTSFPLMMLANAGVAVSFELTAADPTRSGVDFTARGDVGPA